MNFDNYRIRLLNIFLALAIQNFHHSHILYILRGLFQNRMAQQHLSVFHLCLPTHHTTHYPSCIPLCL